MVSARQRDPAVEEQFMGALYKGGELLASGKVVEAREHLEKAHHLEPKNEKAQNLLGLTYFKLGLFDQAAHVYELLVRENPADPTLRVNLGLVYLKTQDLDRSVKEFETATDLDPGHKKAHNYLGLALAQLGDYERAREHFIQAGSDQMAEKMERAAAARAPAPAPERPSRIVAPPVASRASRVAPLPPPSPAEDEAIEVMSDDEPPPPEAEEVSPSGVREADWGQEAATGPRSGVRQAPPPPPQEEYLEAALTPVETRSEPVAVQLEALPADGDLMPVLDGTVVEEAPPAWLAAPPEAGRLAPMWVTETVQDVPLTHESPVPRPSRPSASNLEEAMGRAAGAAEQEAFSEAEAQALLSGEAQGDWETAPAQAAVENWSEGTPAAGLEPGTWEGQPEVHEDTQMSARPPEAQGWDGSLEPAPEGGWNGAAAAEAPLTEDFDGTLPPRNPPVEQGWFDDVEQPAPALGPETTLTDGRGWGNGGAELDGSLTQGAAEAVQGWEAAGQGPEAAPAPAETVAGWGGEQALGLEPEAAAAAQPAWEGQAEGLAAVAAPAEDSWEGLDDAPVEPAPAAAWEGQAEGLEASMAAQAEAAPAEAGWEAQAEGLEATLAPAAPAVETEGSWEGQADGLEATMASAAADSVPEASWEEHPEAGLEATAAPRAEAPPDGGWEAGAAEGWAAAPPEGVQEVAPDAAPTPPPLDPGMVAPLPDAQESEWVMQPVSEALRGGPTPRPSAPPDAVIPPTLSVGFAPLKTQRLTELGEAAAWVQEPGAGPFQLGPAGLAVSVRGEMLTRMTGLVAVVGGVESEPEMRRRRGRPTGDAFGLGSDQLQRVRGHGVLYLEASQSFHSVDLTDQPEEGMDDEGAYLREELVFAFEEGLSFDNGRLSNDASALELVHLKGNGRVLLRLAGALSAMPIPPGTPTVVPVARLVGWFGRVAPRLTGFGGQGAVELTGEGHALLLT